MIDLRTRGGDGAGLPQRRSCELLAAADVDATDRLFLRAELRRVGPAVDLDLAGGKARLAPGNEVNLRGRYEVGRNGAGQRLSLVGSVENLTNGVITPQLGLPLAGRTVRLGFRLN